MLMCVRGEHEHYEGSGERRDKVNNILSRDCMADIGVQTEDKAGA